MYTAPKAMTRHISTKATVFAVEPGSWYARTVIKWNLLRWVVSLRGLYGQSLRCDHRAVGGHVQVVVAHVHRQSGVGAGYRRPGTAVTGHEVRAGVEIPRG